MAAMSANGELRSSVHCEQIGFVCNIYVCCDVKWTCLGSGECFQNLVLKLQKKMVLATFACNRRPVSNECSGLHVLNVA